MSPLSSVRVRIVAAFVAAVLTMASVIGFLIFEYQRVADAQALITEGYLPLSVKVDQMRSDQQGVENDISRLVRKERRPSMGSASPAEIFGDGLRQNLLEARAHAKQAQRIAHGGEEAAQLNMIQTQLSRIEDLVKSYQSGAKEFVVRSEAGDKTAIELQVPLITDGHDLAEEIEKLDQRIEGRIQRLTDQADAQRIFANSVASGLTAGALVLSFALLGAVLSALRPITTLTDHVQRLGRGERPKPLDVRGNDEIALLAREFDGMVEALRIRDDALVDRAEQLDRLSRYLGSVLDSLEDALFVVEGGAVTLANPAATGRWGVEPGRSLPERVLEWTGTVGIHNHHEDGVEYEVRVVPFGNAGVIVVGADVTDQRRALERAARSERLALVGQMLAQITHEVRNPLNAISLNAEMLGDEIGKLDPDGHTEAALLLGTVSSEIERLVAVTAHYLQLARRPRARLAPEDLRDLLGDIARLLNAELDQAGVVLEVERAALPPQLVDGNQLRQAVLNVVRNAVEAGARHLRVEAGAVGDEVHLTLRDDGPGMTADEITRAFDPFYSTKATGTGLGLAITRQILEDHDGTVRVASTAGEGTAVTLAWPRRDA